MRLVPLAWLNIVVHVLALLLALFAMRPGTPAIPLDERLAFLAESPPGWVLGWTVWIGCALVDVAYIVELARRASRGAPFASALAVSLVIAGAAVDCVFDSVHIVVLPLAASNQLAGPGTFLALERMAWAVGAIVANGLYSTATLIVTRALAHAAPAALTRWAVPLAWGTFASGMLMVLAGFSGVPWHLEAAAGPTIGVFVLWTYVTGRDAAHLERAA